MVKVGLLVRLIAKPGKEQVVAEFLAGALPLARTEPETVAWFAIRVSHGEFAIFDAFPSEKGRKAHLDGSIAAALMANAADLLSEPPRIERVDVLASKLPG
jgi:quinol monooxygenase YgiN